MWVETQQHWCLVCFPSAARLKLVHQSMLSWKRHPSTDRDAVARGVLCYLADVSLVPRHLIYHTCSTPQCPCSCRLVTPLRY